MRKLGNIFIDSFISFRTNQIPVRAAAMTYTTLLAFVPFVVILSAVAGAFGYLHLTTRLIPEINSFLGLQLPLEDVEALLDHVENIKLGRLGVVGSVGLFLSFLLAISNLEKAMDLIWEVHKARNWLRKLRVLIPFAILICAFIFVLAWMLMKFKDILDQIITGTTGIVLHTEVKFGGVYLALITLCWLFIIVANLVVPFEKVKLKSALFGSTATILLLSGFLFLAIHLQGFIFSRYSAMYGSLAIFPLIMIFLYCAWVIFLYGVALIRAHQMVILGQISKNV